MESVRQQKVSRLIQKELSTLLQSQFNHIGHGSMVSITVVRITPDLSFARVYLSVFPSTEPKKVVDAYNASLPEICHALYQRIRNQFRKMPEIRFYHDDSLDYAARIDELLSDD
ncbi:MAG: 30S ribosome-binding factor RbfA [Flavobacteriales bacterium]|nr:30S ribosome-binding factor RbfA [Flavobacteriales bacterium]